ncbi:hypothetical protein VNO77_44637 [Canavalia gladiata]|uniref:Uncharacterized protein n=1 Tax=Canavalia gladiata TaxID=3824 RepID=A0AAN9JWA2_CANGL
MGNAPICVAVRNRLNTKVYVLENEWTENWEERVSLGLLFAMAIVAFYSGLLIKRCMDKIGSHPDIDEHAFGKTGRLIVSVLMYTKLYLFVTGPLILEVWLDDLSLRSYVSASGVFASAIIALLTSWTKMFNGDETSGAKRVASAVGEGGLHPSCEVSRKGKEKEFQLKPMRPSYGAPGYVNGSTSLLDASVDALADENKLHDQAATGVSNVFAEALVFLALSKLKDGQLPTGSFRDAHNSARIVHFASAPNLTENHSANVSISDFPSISATQTDTLYIQDKGENGIKGATLDAAS